MCERLKSRGDGYLANECFFSAVKCYESIINDYKGSGLSGSEYSKVYHNLGTAYARMFLYNKAAKYYDDAYKTGQHEYVISREIETLMDNARYSDEYRKLDSINALKQEGNVAGFNASIDEELLHWKEDYMKYSKTF